MKTNKTQLVLKHLQEYGTITSWEAIGKYGATRLSAIIFNLRKNHIINSESVDFTDRYGNKNVIAKYVYVGKRAEKEPAITVSE